MIVRHLRQLQRTLQEASSLQLPPPIIDPADIAVRLEEII
jgi:hypothetical protein